MKKQKYNELKRNSKILKGDKIKKELREKDKSKFLGHRPDLQGKFDFEVSPAFKILEAETIKANRLRRAKLKINQNPHPKSYYRENNINMKLPLIAILISVFTLSFCIIHTIREPQEPNGYNIVMIALDSPSPTEATIRHYASEYGVDVNTSLRIATCESQMGKYKTNWSGSSAKGIYMFISSTWEYYCDGDVLNDEDNVKCFMKLYEENKSWWKCR